MVVSRYWVIPCHLTTLPFFPTPGHPHPSTPVLPSFFGFQSQVVVGAGRTGGLSYDPPVLLLQVYGYRIS
ncbi:hypothetical protein ES705_16204 [subsurface metagenome]